MLDLFVRADGWGDVATKNWSVAGGSQIGLSATVAMGAEAKVLAFTNNDLKKTKAFLMLSLSAGARMEMKIPKEGLMGMVRGGWIDWLLGSGSKGKQMTDMAGSYNTLNFSPPAKVHVEQPFSVKELKDACGMAVSFGATGGVVDAGIMLRSFWGGNPERQLFSMDEGTLQAVLGAGINMGSIHGSVLVDMTNPHNEKYHQAVGTKKGQWYHDTGKI